MLVSAGNGFEGYNIIEYKDIVFGTASSTEGIAYRVAALNKACAAAKAKGANAIVNMNVQIYPVSGNKQEITVYGNAVVIDLKDSDIQFDEFDNNDLETIVSVQRSAVAEVLETNGYKFVSCPSCGTKYKTDEDEDGKTYIKGFEDVDDDEPGLQIYCLRCGTKFTVPGSK